MDIKISIDAEALIDRLDEAIARAEGLSDAMPDEFSAWQEQDMGRRRPDTQTPDPQTAFTIILPRGRPRVIAPARRPGRPIVRARRPGARAPILPPELFDSLRERMAELLGKTFAPWR